MRCTKCHYLSFEPEPRCKNCGHDLSIDELALPIELTASESGQGADALADFHLDRGGSASGSGGVAVLERPAVVATQAPAPVMAAPVMAAPVTAAPPTAELPLFVRDLIPDDEEDLEPLVKVPPRPRAPLAVRRPTPDPVKLRARYAPAEPEPDLWAVADEPASATVTHRDQHPEPEVAATPVPPSAPAVPFGTRAAAAAIDAGILGSIAAIVVVFTMQLAELPLAQVGVLPIIPMLGFFALISVGYELMFTAYSGQTIGKMLVGLKVVSTGDERLSLRQAALRAVSMLPLGAGLLTALVGPGLAVHDRVAHTRVVRA